MKIIFGDFETYYSDEYSLRRMSSVEYILDPRFEMNGVAVAEGNGAPRFLEHAKFKSYLECNNPAECTFVSHNALFDACILGWRYHWVPAMMVDTMTMAAALLKHKTKSISLDSISKFLDLGEKGKMLDQVKGMHAADIKAADLWLDYATYGIDDMNKCREIFKKLSPVFPKSEFMVMDNVIRACVQPRFQLDQHVLAEHLHAIKTQKAQLMARLGDNMTVKDLMSGERFADELRKLGIDPPTKPSPSNPEKQIYAFAKTDQAMADLEEDDNPEVQALVAARLGFKSTLEETRGERFQNISRLWWPVPNVHGATGAIAARLFPVALNYAGAHTHRLSGAWKLNAQNLGKESKLRDALVAPKGYKVISYDASQIEARLVAWFCGQEDLRQAFERGDDIYSMFAMEEIYHRMVNKTDNPKERFVGKQVILGCGFGVGWKKFQNMVKVLSRLILGEEIILEDTEAMRIIDAYRNRYRAIEGMWKKFTYDGFQQIASGNVAYYGPGDCVEFNNQFIKLPNGLKLFYDDLQYRDGQWTFWYAKTQKWLHGGKLLENIIQALARIIIMDAGTRMRLKHGLHWRLQCHDELVYVEKAEIAEQVGKWLHEEMCVRPWWGPTIPLMAEGGIGSSYGDVK